MYKIKMLQQIQYVAYDLEDKWLLGVVCHLPCIWHYSMAYIVAIIRF